MRNKKIKIFIILAMLAAAGVFLRFRTADSGSGKEIVKVISPVTGSIQNIISATGTVLPKNRLEVKPPVPGRVENILVKEGDEVKPGQTLAWMSSTERAALLDAAAGQGEEALKYWKEVYKAIPLISPISGEVIVATTQPGQTVITSEAVIVLSDQLIVRAQVDETDIGKVALKMPAVISLDAYPDKKINAVVEHIYYESETVNNVTIYKVDLTPEDVPPFFRSGMNTTVDFILEKKEGIMVIPREALYEKNGFSYVLTPGKEGLEPVKARVTSGLSDDDNVEIISGVTKEDRILLKSKKYNLPKNDTGTNPFMPRRRR